MSLLGVKKALLTTRLRYIQQTSDTLPAMTSATAPSGHEATGFGGTAYFSAEAWRVFDKRDTGSADFSLQNPNTGGVQRKTPSPIRVWRFGIRNRGSPNNQALKAFALYGSNDGSNYTLLLSVTGQVSWGDYEERYFDIPKSRRAAFLYHKLEITENNGSAATSFNELYLLQEVRR